MSRDLEKILFIPDAHIPYHDKRAWELMLNVAEDFKPDIIAAIGDLGDFFSISRFAKDPTRALQLDKEIEAVNGELDILDALGAKRKLFVEGNHEDRLLRYLQEKAPELFSFISVDKLLHLSDRGWELTPYKSSTKIGKMYLTHDVGSSGKYSIYRCLEAFQHSVISGHTHRFAYLVEGNAAGEHMLSAQFGWLGDVEKVDYMHKIQAKRNWSLGFGIGYLEPSTEHVYVVPVPLVEYSCVINGKLYKN